MMDIEMKVRYMKSNSKLRAPFRPMTRRYIFYYDQICGMIRRQGLICKDSTEGYEKRVVVAVDE